MTIGRVKDLTQKETPAPSRWTQHDLPQAPSTPAPVARVIPAKYLQGTERLAQAEANIARILDGVSPEVSSEVIRRACCDGYFDSTERLGADPGCKAYVFHLTKIRRELGQV